MAPNDLWCADFKGEFKLGNGRYTAASWDLLPNIGLPSVAFAVGFVGIFVLGIVVMLEILWMLALSIAGGSDVKRASTVLIAEFGVLNLIAGIGGAMGKVPAVLTPAKKDKTIEMVKAISKLAGDAEGVNVFRRFAFMEGLRKVEHVSFDQIVDPGDDTRLHQSDWVTDRGR